MKFPKIDHLLTGTAVPVSALKSNENSGIGEFLDLKKLGDWCSQAGIEMIQLLPVNDTGFETSPYSALSAFALHPIYIRLSSLPGASAFAKEIAQIREWHKDNESVAFFNILKDKFDVFKKIFAAQYADIETDAAFESWIKANSWVIEYAVFSTLKHRNELASWQSWTEFKEPTAKEILKFWDTAKNKKETRLFAWLQFEAEKQLIEAADYLTKKGVNLKGDLPILLNDDSADVWAHPDLFDLSLRAGAPPDGTSPDGQNWGFPTYRWENLAKQDYQWWKDRLIQADKFYHAYRIDHVLGFFRIWGTPQADFSAKLGYFSPSKTITSAQLNARGFDNGRITWISEPHIFGQELRDRTGFEADGCIAGALVRVGSEDLFRFKPEIKGERQISELAISDNAKGILIQFWRNRSLIKVSEGNYLPVYTYHGTRGFESLSQDEKWKFENLVRETTAQSAILWEKQGDMIMEFMKNTTPMLVCAEDLGTIPDCVPKVLNNREILGLKIVRWARDWKASGQPYFPVRQYPLLSVCTPSVHDTSTLRQWWDEETYRTPFFNALGVPEVGGPFTSQVAQVVIKGLLESSSLICMFAIQDLFALKPELMTNTPAEERVNTPGTVAPTNWNYKIKPTLEALLTDSVYTNYIESLTKPRRARKVSLS